MVTAKKTTTKKEVKKEPSFFEAIGRRKTSTARVRLFTQGNKTILINDKDYKDYFPTLELQEIVDSAFDKMKALDKFKVTVKVKGGGIHSQAEAVRHGIARALVGVNPDFRKRLRRVGYLTRDSRMRERKKFGLKRARRGPQWSKR
jgi:small subunit ribosomal protein S9